MPNIPQPNRPGEGHVRRTEGSSSGITHQPGLRTPVGASPHVLRAHNLAGVLMQTESLAFPGTEGQAIKGSRCLIKNFHKVIK